MQFYIILDHYYYHICVQEVGKAWADTLLGMINKAKQC